MISREQDRKAVKDFLDASPDIKESIIQNEWEDVWKVWNNWRRGTTIDCGSLAKVMIDSNIDFLSHMTFIPTGMFTISRFVGYSLVLPPTITRINWDAFGFTAIDSIKLSNNLKYIGEKAFREFVSTKDGSLLIPKSVREIDKDGYTFSGSNFKEIIFEKGNSIDIPKYCFEFCRQLIKIDLGSVEALGFSSFLGCSSLNEVYIPDTCSIIDSYCFDGCINLKKIRLPEEITIHPRAFNDCRKLEEIEYDGDLVQLKRIMRNYATPQDDFKYNNIICKCNDGTYEMYLTDDGHVHVDFVRAM